MKKRIISLLVTLVVAISVVLGISLTSSAADGDGLKNSAISLAENVTLKMEIAIASPTPGAYAKITVPGKDDNKVDITQLVATAPKSGDNYVFYAEVAVKDLAKNVTIEICNANGTTLVAASTTTALAYCEKYLAQNGENEFDGLVTALKVYANAADYYFDAAKTAAEANDADFEGVADAAFDPAKLPAGITHRSATLLLESETTIRHYFELAEGKKIDDYTFFVDLNGNGKAGVDEKLTAKSKATEDGKTVYYVDIAGLTPNMLDEVYTVGVTDGEKVYTCDYGVLTYLKRAYANGDNDTKNLAAAILAYNNEAAQLKGIIEFNTDGGSVVVDQEYEYGVNTPVIANTAKDSYGFIGWADANGNIVNAISPRQTGKVTLTAKWAYSMGSGFDYSVSTYHGYCDNHTAENSVNGICKTCGFCTTNCAASGETACGTCGKGKADGGALFGVANPPAGNNPTGYSKPYTVDGQLGTLINYTNLSNVQYQLNAGGGSFAQVFNAGGRCVSIAFDAMRMNANDTVPNFYFRTRSSEATGKAEVSLLDFSSEKTDGIRILGAASGVKIDTTAKRYEFLFDMTNANSSTSGAAKGYIVGTILVDGVAKFTTTYDIDTNKKAYVDQWTNDGYASFRFQSGGTMWFSNFYVGPTQNAIVYNGIDVPANSPYTYTTGTATPLTTPTDTNEVKFLGWFADSALTQPIDEIPANAYGRFDVYAKTKTLKTIVSITNEATEPQYSYISYNNFCKHIVDPVGQKDANGFCKECGAHIHTSVADASCSTCGYATAVCKAHTDAVTLSKSNINTKTADEADGYCDVCGSSVTATLEKNMANSTQLISGDGNGAAAMLVVDDDGNYVRLVSPHGSGPAYALASGPSPASALQSVSNKVLTYSIEFAKDSAYARVINLDIRTRGNNNDYNFTIFSVNNGKVLAKNGTELLALTETLTKLYVALDFDNQVISYYDQNGNVLVSYKCAMDLSKLNKTNDRLLGMRFGNGGNAAIRIGDINVIVGNPFD